MYVCEYDILLQPYILVKICSLPLLFVKLSICLKFTILTFCIHHGKRSNISLHESILTNTYVQPMYKYTCISLNVYFRIKALSFKNHQGKIALKFNKELCNFSENKFVLTLIVCLLEQQLLI